MNTIRMTLEVLYDILRNEKKREDLQKLEETFFLDVVQYLQEKQALLDSKKDESELFVAGEKKKLEYELNSIRRILKEIYDRREKKILDIALNRSRTGSDIIDTSALLQEEKVFYGRLVANLERSRQGVLLQLFKGELPAFGTDEPIPKKSQAVPEPAEQRTWPAGPMKIRFIHPTPTFVWKDLKTYGPFDPGEETEIAAEAAELLIRKKRAERI